MTIDIKTIILHCKKLVERKESIFSQMTKFGFSNYSFYEKYDGDELTDEDIKKYYVSILQMPGLWEEKVKSILPSTFKTICNKAEISLAIKWGKVFEEMSSQLDDYFIAFEDDVILCDDFTEKFHDYFSRTPQDWDIIYLGGGKLHRPDNIKENQIAYLRGHPASRCLDSILLKRKTAKQLASTWFPFNAPADWQISYEHYRHNHIVYWWEPPLAKQGSEFGIFKSALR